MNIFNIRSISLLSSHKYINKLAPQSPYLHVMNEEELHRLQQNILRIYLDIQTFCDMHGLTIMMGYGSALGAVRHKGFIPWDDDIDVLMPRKDYGYLINHFEEEYGDRYWVVSPLNHEEVLRDFVLVSTNPSLHRRTVLRS